MTGSTKLFKFPSDPKISNLWKSDLPNDPTTLVINDYNGVCINHFDADSIEKNGSLFKLKQDAVPSIF